MGSPRAASLFFGEIESAAKPASVLPPGSVGPPSIVTRAQWGADEARRRGAPVFTPPRKIGVHHTALATLGDPAADVRAVYDLHLTRDGGTWSDIGYHFLIDPQGRVYEGRYAREYDPDQVHDGHDAFGRVARGSHAQGHNSGTLGIALMGNYQGAAPTDSALESLVDVVAWLCDVHRIDPEGQEAYADAWGSPHAIANVFGHRDVRDTLCPGQVTYDLLPDLRRAVAGRLAGSVRAPSGGYRIAHADGTVSARGTASDLGDPARHGTTEQFVGAAALAGSGAWLLDRRGGVFTLGETGYHGSIPELINAGAAGHVSAVALAPTPTGAGYWILDRHGAVYSFGEAAYHGSLPDRRPPPPPPPPPPRRGRKPAPAPEAPVYPDAVAMASSATGNGYWILDAAGAVHPFGDAPDHGSLTSVRAAGGIADAPAVDLRRSPGGAGYWILDRRGGVFTFGDAPFFGSAPGSGFPGAAPAVQLVPTPGGGGYHVLCADGSVLPFGDAPFAGHGPHVPAVALA